MCMWLLIYIFIPFGQTTDHIRGRTLWDTLSCSKVPLTPQQLERMSEISEYKYVHPLWIEGALFAIEKIRSCIFSII
jgi:hypothetical protein